MRNKFFGQIITVALAGVFVTGCESLPGDDKTQGAVIGGATGAAVGAGVGGSDNRVMGAVIGGVLGAAGGYVIGANKDKILGRDEDDARQAGTRARTTPVTAEQARAARTADINNDNFVTLDEVAALEQAGLSDSDIITRLEATGQIFDLTPEGRQYLRERGVSDYVIRQMPTLNQERRELLLREMRGR
jgi:hypothetical protein